MFAHPISMGDMVAWPIFGAFSALVIDGTSMVPLGAAAGVIGAVVMLTRRWTILEDKLDAFNTRLEKLEKLLETRPCFYKPGECPTNTEKKQ